MALLTGANLGMRYGPFDIFETINISIHHGERAAIVGPNGQGKTTLLRILAGEETPTTGEGFRAKGLKIGYLRQEVLQKPAAETLWQLALDAFADVIAKGEELKALEKSLAADDSLLEKYGHLQTEFELLGGYHYQQTIKTVLTGLGFSETQYRQPLAQFSGGQQTRAQLAWLLLQRPELLLLDEPTNHLDLAAIEWLENYLAAWRGAVLIVSHDRYFLDAVVNRVFELSFSRLEKYRGNYSAYIRQRAERIARHEKEYIAQQRFIAKEEEFIRRNLAGQRTKEAQGRRKRLERLKRDHLIERIRREKRIHMALGTAVRSGDLVLATHNLAIGYPDGDIFLTVPDVEIRRGQRIALLGDNGSGKTTLLRTILREIPPKRGKIRRGAAVEIGYFPQIHTDLRPENSVLDELRRANDNMTIAEARNHLARFLFFEDDVLKNVGDLSGGERSRLALAKFVLSGANFLILDEPTNHLDIPAQEMLEAVLRQFNGTMLLVSHDRYFIDALATHIWHIHSGELHPFKGNYRQYRQFLQATATPTAAENRTPESPGKRQHLETKAEKRAREKRQRELASLETAIESAQERVSQLENEMAQAGASQQIDRLQQLAVEYQQAEKQLAELLEHWVSLESEA